MELLGSEKPPAYVIYYPATLKVHEEAHNIGVAMKYVAEHPHHGELELINRTHPKHQDLLAILDFTDMEKTNGT